MIRYWSTMEAAAVCGVTEASFRSRKVPEPDAMIGRIKGWKPSTIKEWDAKHYAGKVRVGVAKCAPVE